MQPDIHDDREFVLFYERTIDVVYGYFMRRTAGDRQLAEDLTQETFLTAARTFDATVRNETAWVVTIARRRMIDYIRRTLARPQVTHPGELPEQLSWPAGWDHEERDVFAALSRLGPDQRLAMLLHYVDGLSVGQVAGMMDRPRGAVYSLLARGRRALKTELKETSDG